MTDTLFDKAYGCLLGLAIGDALGAPVEGWSAGQISETHGWVDDFLTDAPVGTDDTEFAILTARNLIQYGEKITPEDVEREWRKLIDTRQFFGGGFSEAAAIRNLKMGLSTPLTGRNNPEMWSDGTAMRIAPVGIFCAGDPAKAAGLALIDGMISHAGDGLFAAQAVAASVAVAAVSSSWDEVVQAGLRYIPHDSWTYRLIERAILLADACTSLQEAARRLHDEISVHQYYWVDVGPEAVALAYGAIVAGKGNYRDSVVCAVNCGRDADTIAAIAGAITGAYQGIAGIPESWISRINPVRGKCIVPLAGTDIKSVAEELVAKIHLEQRL
ncbi:crystallin J1 [Brevibacillus sp. SYP-B805]|uniref:ADP-ribosylglycohydrolase family protein n=1 Tax=Brevibacillus sp. SYP-B805 TaxID=1578199 RepID=UPI0013EE2DF4|nr:ADP-ribosylglycohydrolase family protein [Brevibacillus sp. SYP-B805]NGQ95859.1 crystallin J1 [Brevibacillus sp. SYP-B805]